MKIKAGWMALVIISGIIMSCEKNEKPNGVLDKEKLASVLVDMYVAEARLSTISISADSASKIFRPFEQILLERNGANDSIMKLTYSYYVDHPAELEAVYDIAIDTLSLREQRAGVKK